MVPFAENCLETVSENDYAFLMESSTLEYITAQNCNLTKIGGNLDSKGYGLATRLDYPGKEQFSVAILKVSKEKLDF